MKYRPEIDGLRAVAVLPVILFHAKIGPFHGGFIGVDIFFVISGYLITSLLIADIGRGSFSLIHFYERRARRILPALFVVMFACIPFALMWMFPLPLNDFFQSLIATSLFSSNILFWLESGYFSADAELKPLLHTWSLAIEEQYYIFFPPLLYLLWRGGAARWVKTTLCLGAIAALSLALAMFGTVIWPDANFYLLPARAWELLAGAFCALALTRWTIVPNGWLAAAGGGLIAVGLFLADDTLWPSWMTLLPVAGSALLILFATSGHGIGRGLAWGPMVGIGLISYSAYLWHQPLFAFARLRLIEEPSAVVFALLCLATLGLAYLTWRYVEQPFRKRTAQGPAISRKAVFSLSGGVGALLIAIGLTGDVADGFPNRTTPSGQPFIDVFWQVKGGYTDNLDCDTDISWKPVPSAPSASCTFRAANTNKAKRAILIGDSHATVLSRQIQDDANKMGIDISVMTFGGCIPFPGFDLAGRPCDAANSAAYDHIAQEQYDIIVLAARPQYMLTQDEVIRFDPPREGSARDQVLTVIEQGLQRLLTTGAQVIVVEPIPDMPLDIGQYALKRFAFDETPQSAQFTTPRAHYMDRAGPVLSVLDAQETPALIRVSPRRALCDGPQGACIGIDRGTALYTDDNHLSKRGLARLQPALRAALQKALERL